MDKDKTLDEIFENDPLGLLNFKPRSQSIRTSDERMKSSFDEINQFYKTHHREPLPNTSDISEYQLYSRLKGFREDPLKAEMLKELDEFGLLQDSEEPMVAEPRETFFKPKKIKSIDDIFSDDQLDLLGDDSGLFEFNHTPKDYERAQTDYVAKRRPCKDFQNYEELFKSVQVDLSHGRRKLVPFKQDNLRAGDFYVNNGILLYLESVDLDEGVQEFSSGPRYRKDGRTRTIFENGTESSMLYRSLYKVLLMNGKAVTQNFEKVNEGFSENFGQISGEDQDAGYIYVLRSLSQDEQIKSVRNLYKIGFSKNDVNERIKNAEQEPTYLMAKVDYVAGWKCFNMNTQKFEQLIHTFFGSSCLNVDVFDERGRRFTPREWFIAPLPVIEQAIELIINGKIVNYRYDVESEMIVGR
ncbi:GIY-YIG nuclease family protein [Algoriphagus halophilus]|uniref:GIY-YIG nuclease family protein n=1 Tax=Algoriphagus halophilus TaxID=226505 RepID=UPI00358F9C49